MAVIAAPIAMHSTVPLGLGIFVMVVLLIGGSGSDRVLHRPRVRQRTLEQSRLELAHARCVAESAGLTGFYFHDPRHAGNHIAAVTGASLRELMGRMGTTPAALSYQRRTAEGDRLIVAVLSDIVEAELGTADGPEARIGHALRAVSADKRDLPYAI